MITTPEGKKIFMLNSSALKEADCKRRIYWKIVRGVRGRGFNYKADFGNAMHRGIKVWYSTYDKEKAIQAALDYHAANVSAPVDSGYEINNARAVMTYYTALFSLHDDLKPLCVNGEYFLEIPFEETIYDSPELEIKLCGTIDFVGFYNILGNNYPVVCDHKTTGYTDSSKFFLSYRESAQGLLYVAMFRRKFPELSTTNFLVNGLFLRKNTIPKFERSEVITIDQGKIDRYFDYLNTLVEEIVREFKTGRWDFNYNACAGKFNKPCAYCILCNINREDDRESVIRSDFDVIPYNPLLMQNEFED